MAAAIGSSIRFTLDAPAAKAESRMALRSTWVEPQGTQITMRGGAESLPLFTLRINAFNMRSVTLKSAITPSFIGRMA